MILGKKATAILIVSFIAISGIGIAFFLPSPSLAERKIIRAADFPNESYRDEIAEDSNRFNQLGNSYTDSALSHFYSELIPNENASIDVESNLYIFRSTDGAQGFYEQARSNEVAFNANVSTTNISVGNACVVYLLHQDPQRVLRYLVLWKDDMVFTSLITVNRYSFGMSFVYSTYDMPFSQILELAQVQASRF
jgi:hypothetical protein